FLNLRIVIKRKPEFVALFGASNDSRPVFRSCESSTLIRPTSHDRHGRGIAYLIQLVAMSFEVKNFFT
ncbi:hypothetical protein, partial [Klebsiella pneumoniae]|uniref:hypothetical protein n=1 Tax=Klebsiella pneumoniae TaxID=573 RepID=UPI0019670031